MSFGLFKPNRTSKTKQALRKNITHKSLIFLYICQMETGKITPTYKLHKWFRYWSKSSFISIPSSHHSSPPPEQHNTCAPPLVSRCPFPAFVLLFMWVYFAQFLFWDNRFSYMWGRMCCRFYTHTQRIRFRPAVFIFYPSSSLSSNHIYTYISL